MIERLTFGKNEFDNNSKQEEVVYRVVRLCQDKIKSVNPTVEEMLAYSHARDLLSVRVRNLKMVIYKDNYDNGVVKLVRDFELRTYEMKQP